MIAVYPGSFDPITVGHLDLIQRSSRLFSDIVVGIGTNSLKTPLFNAGERASLVKEACAGIDNVKVEIFGGLLVNFCKSIDCRVIVRGLRVLTDFEAELAMDHVNHMLDPDIETVYLGTRAESSFVSSSMVREIARHGGNITPLVPANVAAALKRKLSG